MTREEAIRKLQKQKAEYLEEWVDFSGVAEAYDMAIKALEDIERWRTWSHTYNNLISRQDAIEAIARDIPFITFTEDPKRTAQRIIGTVPSADRPTGWIPVSERLPDIGDTYLVTVMVGKEIRTDVADSFGSYIDGFWDTFNDWIEDEECHVIAWMPLPPGYQGE